jgi:hypothetical protein
VIRPLHDLSSEHRYQAKVLPDTAIRVQPTESVEDVVRGELPLADNHLRREVAEIVFELRSQAKILKVGKDELDDYLTDVANIHTFAPSSHDSLREMAKKVRDSYDRENAKMAKAISDLDEFAASIKE